MKPMWVGIAVLALVLATLGVIALIKPAEARLCLGSGALIVIVALMLLWAERG